MYIKQLNEILHKWDIAYRRVGIPKEEIQKNLEYVAALIKKDLPPILDLRHLSLLMGIEYTFVIKTIFGTESFYRNFSILKRLGGFRTITAPYPSLKYMQRWIYDKILSNQKTHFCAHGFVKHRSILTNAKVHENCGMLLKMDISDFFGSISQNAVINYFYKALGYNLTVSYFLSAICCKNKSLPQGAPTSPILSNLISISFDRRLYRLAKYFNLKYTRYADDIAFSGDKIPITFISYVKNIAKSCGYEINDNKTRLYGAGGSKIIAGVSLATGVPKVPRDYKRKLKQELHFIEKFGLAAHMKHNKIRQYNYVDTIRGQISYVLSIEPNNKYMLRMRDLLTKSF